MKIGIDAKWYFNGPVGPRTYVRNLIDHLARVDSSNEYIIYLNKNDDPTAVSYSAPNFVTKNLSPSQSWLRVMLKFSQTAAQDKLDVLLTSNFCPLVCRAKRVVMIYDIIYETHPEFFTTIEHIFFKAIRVCGRRADRVLTISEYCKDAIARIHGVDPARIHVTPLATNESFKVNPDQAVLARVRQKYDLPERFVLYVGRLNIRKNLVRLIEAYGKIEDKDVPLVIVGAKDWKSSDLAPAIEGSGVRDRLQFLGYVPDEDLPTIMQLATVFVYLSLAEGFGLPPLEAMGCGAPVISSNTTSLPEVVGDCALAVNPQHSGEIVDALNRLLSSADLRLALSRRGIERAASFNWEECARQTVAVLEDVHQN